MYVVYSETCNADGKMSYTTSWRSSNDYNRTTSYYTNVLCPSLVILAPQSPYEPLIPWSHSHLLNHYRSSILPSASQFSSQHDAQSFGASADSQEFADFWYWRPA